MVCEGEKNASIVTPDTSVLEVFGCVRSTYPLSPSVREGSPFRALPAERT